MANNTELNAGSGGDIIASDDVAGVKYQIVKLASGAEDAATMVSAAAPLPVTDAASAALLGTIDADTGNAATSLAVIDDWDESDRAKVNPIVGQAGVQGASGAVSASTQRVVLATDVPLPAGSNAIGTVTSAGGAAHDAPVAGNPHLLAAYASAAAPSDVTGDGDAVRLWALRSGALVVRSLPSSAATRTTFNATTDTQVIAANTARKRISFYNDGSVDVLIGEGTTTVTTTDFSIRLAPGGFAAFDDTTAAFRGLFVSAPTGSLKVTEST